MKKTCATIGTLFVAGATFAGTVFAEDAAKPLPAMPDTCVEDIWDQGYCSTTEAGALTGPIQVSIFLPMSKDLYPTTADVIKRYTDYDSWDDFVEASGSDAISFTHTIAMEDFVVTNDAGESTTYSRQYFDYTTPAPFPLPRQRVLGVGLTKEVPAYAGADSSFEFETILTGEEVEVPADHQGLSDKPMGLKSQVGSLHVISCTGEQEYCEEGEFFLIYNTTVQPNVELLPRVAAPYILRSIEAILIGMFLS